MGESRNTIYISRMNSQPLKHAVTHTWVVACRPTLLFVVAYALNVTPHEFVHALTSYSLGFNSTVFQMWVNPDSAQATASQLAIIAVSGPLFSLFPPENATGNYVKIVQRIPVKIVLEAGENQNRQLRPGMNVVPDVFLQ